MAGAECHGWHTCIIGAAIQGAMVRNQQVLAEWLSQAPNSIIARGCNMYNWKNTALKIKC